MKESLIAVVLLLGILFMAGCGANVEKDAVADTSSGQQGQSQYFGELDKGNRWFLAKVTDSKKVVPLGTGYFEANYAEGEGCGIIVQYTGIDGDSDKKLCNGDIVKITYNGYIIETYPPQIDAIMIETVSQ